MKQAKYPCIWKKGLALILILGVLLLSACSAAKEPSRNSDAAVSTEPVVSEQSSNATEPQESSTEEELPTSEELPATEESSAPESSEEPEQPEELTGDPALAAALQQLCDADFWFPQILTSRFAVPERIDLFNLFYNGIPGVPLYESEAQQRELEAAYPDLADPHTDVDRLPVTEMDQILRQYLGLGLEQTGKRNLDLLDFYAPEADSYFHEHGDTNMMRVTVLDAARMEDGRILFLYRSKYAVEDAPAWTAALRPSEDGYQVLSNLPGRWVTAETAGALELLNEKSSAWKIEAETGEAIPGEPELYLFEGGSLVFLNEEHPDGSWGSWHLEGDDTLCCDVYGNQRFRCVLEGDTLILTPQGDSSFGDEEAGTVLRLLPMEEEAFQKLKMLGVLYVLSDA